MYSSITGIASQTALSSGDAMRAASLFTARTGGRIWVRRRSVRMHDGEIDLAHERDDAAVLRSHANTRECSRRIHILVMKKNTPTEDVMPAATYRVARMDGDQLEVLGEFNSEADALDMADRAKYMKPFVLRTRVDGTVEVLGAMPGSGHLREH